MNNKKILRLVLPVALSTGLMMISNLSFAADTKTLGGPVKSPLSKTPTTTSKPVSGVTTNKLSPTNTKTTQTLNNNALSKAAQDSAKKKTLTPVGVSSASGPETYIRTLEDRSRAYALPDGADRAISKFNRAYSAYKSMADAYETKFRQCMAKAYTAEERSQVGCTATTTVARCESNLLRRCMRNMNRGVRNARLKMLASFEDVSGVERTIREQRR